MAYTREINPNTPDSHQTSPAYCLTFLRWSNRDTVNYTSPGELEVREPLVVVNDAVSLTVSNTKDQLNPVFSCTLLAGDINYATALNPGDFVLVNMVNFEQKAMQLRERALNLKPINKYDDGFKGVFKVKQVRKRLVTNPQTGIKQYAFNITAIGFDEFNNMIYYNPAIVQAFSQAGFLFLSQFGEFWNKLVIDKNSNNINELLKAIILSTIGYGTKSVTSGKVPQDQTPRFQVPKQLGQLLNKNTSFASDLYDFVFGIWKGFLGSSSLAKPSKGFNFGVTQDSGNFYTTGIELQGKRQIASQDFNMVKAWSLLNNYCNSLINEIYTTYRVNSDGYVQPTVICRQKPFTSEHYGNTEKDTRNNQQTENTDLITRFFDLPRWKVSPDFIYDYDLGKDDQARINFVQVFTKSISINKTFNDAAQIAEGNFEYDKKDVIRSGLKPYIATANFDYPFEDKGFKGREWSQLVADWVLDGHLRESGVIKCYGIEEPICVGDNFEFDNVVYHIEKVTHQMQITGEGVKQFLTTINVSFGTDLRSNKNRPVYPEMEHTDSYTKRREDYNFDRVLPGFSDTQDLPSRTKGEETKETKQKSFTQDPEKRRK